MKLRKRLGALLVSTAMLFTMLPGIGASKASAATTGSIVLTINSPTMMVNGVSKPIDAEGSKPVLDKGGYTMLPLRGIVEAMGGSLTWDATTRALTMVKENQTVQLKVGSTKATVNGVEKDMLSGNTPYKAPYINSAGRTLGHVRALELFTGTTCSWNQATQQVTVTYTTNGTVAPPTTSKNYRIDVINKSGADVDTLQYGTSGTWTYGQNVLTSKLANNGTGSFYISVPDNATVRMYDFYTESSSNGTKYFQGLNLNGVNAYVTLVLKPNGKFEQHNDKTVTIATTDLKFVNNSSEAVEELYMSKTNSFKDATNLLATETVKAGGSTTVQIDLDGQKDWYFQVVTSKGTEKSKKVTFPSTTTESETLTFSKSKTLSLNGSGDTTLTFENKSGDTIEEIYLATSKSDLDDADNLLSDDLDDKDTTDISIDLDSERSWYIKVVFDRNSDIKSQSLSFKYKDPIEATIRVNKSSAEIRDEKRGESDSDGDITLALINNTNQDIEEAYLVEDRKDFDRDDEDDILGGTVEAGEYMILDNVTTADKYDLILYYGSGSKDYDYLTVDFSDADTYATVYIDSYSSSRFNGKVRDDSDDEMIVGIYNDTGKELTNVEVVDYDNHSKRIENVGTLKDGNYYYFELDSDSYPDVELSWKEYNDYVEITDIDYENPFALLTINYHDDDDVDVEGIDDL